MDLPTGPKMPPSLGKLPNMERVGFSDFSVLGVLLGELFKILPKRVGLFWGTSR